MTHLISLTLVNKQPQVGGNDPSGGFLSGQTMKTDIPQSSLNNG